MTRETDTIVQELRGMRSNSDFTHVATEIKDLQRQDPGHFQRNLAQINQSVHMKDLGFPEDFKIAGVDSNGHLVTTSQDGGTVQRRDSHNMSRVESTTANTPATERWGSRDFTTNPADGSATYKTKEHDTLWSIANDALTHKLGHAPSNTEIANAVNTIAKENNISDPNHLMQKRDLRLSGMQPTDTAQPQRPGNPEIQQPAPLPANNGEIQPRNGVSNPLAVPGLGSDVPGDPKDPAVRSREATGTTRNSDGTNTTSYTGKLADGILWDTSFTAQRTTDAQGNLVNNKVDYSGGGASIKIDTGNGAQTLDHVKSVETTFNRTTGNYETVYKTTDGSQYRAQTGRDGRVTSYGQAQSGYQPDLYVPQGF